MRFVGSPPISVKLRRTARARRMTLRLSRLDGQATLTVPQRISDRTISEFLSDKETWLRQQLEQTPDRIVPMVGVNVLYKGAPHTLTKGQKIQVLDGQISVPEIATTTRLRAFFKLQARDTIVPLVDTYTTKLNRHCNRLTLRDTRSRWGSCSQDGNLMFSWRLIMAPPAVLEYVVVHEVSHLVELNHSAAYWDVVESLMPNYRAHKNWLRENGTKLHALDFTA